MDVLAVLRKIKKDIKTKPTPQKIIDFTVMVREGLKDEDILNPVREQGKWLSDFLEERIPKIKDVDEMKTYYTLHEQILLVLAPHDFDSYCMYLEWDRQPKSKFYAPRRKQLRPLAEAMQDLYYGNLELLCISLPPGIGKALGNDTPILTRRGWKKHGDLVVGDEVIGIDGKFKKVTHVHPKCDLDVLIEFSNGEKIMCHENHVWRFFDRTKQKTIEAETKYFEGRSLSAGEEGKRGHRYNIQVPAHSYVVGEHKDLPLDPYVFGVWLGDGTTTQPTITSPLSDKAIIDRIVERGYPISWQTKHKTTGVMSYGFGFRDKLRLMNMCHSRETLPKHIPEMYLTASIEQRLDLLAGLIDTDGCMKYDGRYSFSTTSAPIRDAVVALTATFGWRASVSEYEPRTSSSGIVGRKTTYVVSFSADCVIPCALSRKRNTSLVAQRKVGVKSITRVKPVQGNCITVEGDGMYLAGRTLIPTHNSALALFFLSWWGGKIPNRAILTISHNFVFVKEAYEQMKKIIGKDSEYRYHDVFPEATIKSTDAQGLTIALDKSARFSTFTFASLGSNLAGRVRAESLLFCDDLIPNIEVALSEDQLNKVWTAYTSDLLQRKVSTARELHIATRWSVRDVIGRLELKYEAEPWAKFIKVPAMDSQGRSKFDYPFHLGYTSEQLWRLRDDMDEATFNALYMQEPIEREGQLYADEELQKFFSLPDRDPDAILAVCDTKDRGEDYFVLPIAYLYGNQVYIQDVICNDGKPEIVEELIAKALVKNKVQIARFESNSAGGEIAKNVQKLINDMGGFTKITTKYTTANKETKIIVNSAYVKEHFLFKDNSVITKDREYKRMMQFLKSYTLKGKNKHDDVPDAMAMLALFVQDFTFKAIEVFTRPF